MEGDYSELLSSSIFCLVIPGDGWSARMDDATLHGCIPVIIMVGVLLKLLLALVPFLLAACCHSLQEVAASWRQQKGSLPHLAGHCARLL